MIELRLNRKKYTNIQILGTMDVYKDNLFICSFATLEQAWNNNETSNSCIPKGHYIVEHYNSNAHPNSFILKQTEPRTFILIHSGNYYKHTSGCILIGFIHSDINNDGYLDTIYSKNAMDKLRKITEGESIIYLSIK